MHHVAMWIFSPRSVVNCLLVLNNYVSVMNIKR